MSTAEQMVPGVERRQRAFPLYALLAGNVVSSVGDTLTLLAIPWFVLETTGSVAQAGVVGFFAVLAMVISAALGSVLVDRLGYQRTSVTGDVLSGVAVALIPLLHHTVGLAFWQLIALVFLGGLCKAPAATARSTLVPNLAEQAGMRLERANAFDTGALQVSAFVGAPLAGLLIALIGTSNLLWFDAASFGLSALIIGLCVPTGLPVEQQAHAARASTPRQSYGAELREGLLFLRDPLLLTLMMTFIITNMIDRANTAVVLPAYALATYGNALQLGLLYSAFGGAAFAGTLLFASIGHRLPRLMTLCGALLLGGVLRYVVMLVPSFPLHLAWFVVAGLALSPINPIVFTIIQERTPRPRLARVMGVGRALVMAGMPLGALFGGLAVQAFGLVPTIAGMGVVYLLVTLALLRPSVRQAAQQP